MARHLYVVPGARYLLLIPGNIDLLHRPQVRNTDGSVSTVLSVTFTLENGTFLLIPRVVGNRVVSARAALRYWQKTGQFLGIFRTNKAAERYSVLLHNQQAKYYGLN